MLGRRIYLPLPRFRQPLVVMFTVSDGVGAGYPVHRAVPITVRDCKSVFIPVPAVEPVLFCLRPPPGLGKELSVLIVRDLRQIKPNVPVSYSPHTSIAQALQSDCAKTFPQARIQCRRLYKIASKIASNCLNMRAPNESRSWSLCGFSSQKNCTCTSMHHF